MKKLLLTIIMALFIVMLVGCSKDKVIKVEEVNTNTVLIKNDGTVQSATVEVFDKEYYNLTELTTFITKEIQEYNQTNGTDSIVLNKLELSGENAVLVLDYTSINHYNSFSGTEVVFTSVESARNGEITLPDVFTDASDSAATSVEVALKNDSYRVLVFNENTDVMVDGTVKYYANAVLVNKSKIQTGSDGETVIVYKP